MAGKLLVTTLCGVSIGLASSAAHAQPGVSVSGEASTDGTAEGEATGSQPLSRRLDQAWIRRWAPENNTGELGIYGGIFAPSKNIELFRPDAALPDQGHKRFSPVAADIGLRLGYYPVRHFGIEAEGGFMPTSADDGSGRATMWTIRGQVVGQLGYWSVVPFALVGAGLISVASDPAVVGNDKDPALHLGIGAKAYLNRWLQLRLDVRDVMTPRAGINRRVANNVEVLLGLSVTLGRKKDVDDAGPEPLPAPAPTDRDGDGFLDMEDACPDEPGIAPDGCPVGDRDNDGFDDSVDACPDEPGIAPDGCPDPDPDKDGILGDADKCPTDPETKNGYEDTDGCPDELPEEVKKFQGTLEGIYFDTAKDTIKKRSTKVLAGAVDTLKKFPDIRIEIAGHTDNKGKRPYNMDLSDKRSKAVKKYLVDHGIDASRIETRGAGPDEPIDSNSSAAGRSRNRRIEFRILR